jgi:ElaB/YqjD/DUF883 family membrane-anchored ribosome-binding protein
MTRERMSDTIAQLERKLNLLEVVREHPWPAVALAAGAGFALANTNADVKAASATAAATVKATGGASSRLGEVLDAAAASAITALSGVLEQKMDSFVSELKGAIGATDGRRAGSSTSSLRDAAPTGNGPAVSRTGESMQGSSGNNQSLGAREPGRASALEQPM